MPSRDTDIRAVTLVDIPLVRRLEEKSIILDCELNVTGDQHGALSTLLLQREVTTLVARSDKQQAAGQFRMRADDAHARLVYLAPAPDAMTDDTALLHVLDAMAREAGKQGAHALIAEVEESSPLFETMRTAGFAVYARQDIWRHEPITTPASPDLPLLSFATDDDENGILALFGAIVPGLVQPFALPAPDMDRLIYRTGDRIDACVIHSEGKNGIYVMPYIHPDLLSEASLILEAALRMIPRSSRLPIYICVRRYQDWIASALLDLHGTPVLQQALMIRHIAAGVRHPEFAPLPAGLESITRPVRPHRYHEGLPICT